MDDPQDTLPAVEADRDLDDWGRSARLAALLDRTVWDAAYGVWFRVALQGVDRIPASGGALLVVNGGGALSPVAPMLAKAVREEHPRRRESRLAVTPALLAQPGLAVAL
ncbi:hypothetical protein ACVU7I_13895, partial [Patulibacter sp. S7RM1-6]